MRTLLILLSLTGAAWAQQQNLRRQEDPRGARFKPKTSAGPEVSIRGAIETTYDDNIIDLSEKQRDQFNAGTKPQKYRIEQEEDFMTSFWTEVGLKARLFSEPTRFGLKAQANAYQGNSFANYEEFTLFVRQDLGKHEMGVEYEVAADVYHRELEIIVPGPNLWESAFYTEHKLEAFYRHRVAPWLTLRGFGGYEQRDFDSPFGFRDLEGGFVGIQPTVTFGKQVAIFLQYRYRAMEADPGDLEEDTSYREHEIEPGIAAFFFGQALEVSLRHRVGFREFTSSNDPFIDASHVDREDRRERTVLRVTLRLHKNWWVEAQYLRRNVDSDRPFDFGDPSEAVESTRNAYTLGVGFNF